MISEKKAKFFMLFNLEDIYNTRMLPQLYQELIKKMILLLGYICLQFLMHV